LLTVIGDGLDAAAARGERQPYGSSELVAYYRAMLRERAPVVVLRDVQARYAAHRRGKHLPLA
jgi:hypothetical protein